MNNALSYQLTRPWSLPLSLLTDYSRVSKAMKCPICGRSDWCLISRKDSRDRAICSRIESDRRLGDAGWLHCLGPSGPSKPRQFKPHTRQVTIKIARPDLAHMAQQWQSQAAPTRLSSLALILGLSVESLNRLNVGWTGSAWSFPMTNVHRDVIGIRLRTISGRKFSVAGGHEGLFVPTGLLPGAELLICEGATDTAALIDMGFAAVGRPCCSGGTCLLVEYINRQSPASVVVFADADGPGQRGASTLVTTLSPYCRDVRIVTPPAKDARAWLQAGATHSSASLLIADAAPIKLLVTRQRKPFP